MDLRLPFLLFCLGSQGVTYAEELSLSRSGSTVEKTDEASSPPPTAATEHACVTAPAEDNEDLSAEELEGCESLGQDAIAKGVQRMGVQLLQNLEAKPEEPNVIISPLSIYLALSQLALGAANETEELLMRHLHANALPCYHESLRNVLLKLRNSDLEIATRIFLHKEFQPKKEFVSESRRLYESEPKVLEGLQQINEWVEKATGGKMTGFLTSLPPNLLLMLINAVHYKGEWQARFDPSFTSRGSFYIDENQMVDVEMMEGAKHPLSLLDHNELESQVARFRFRNRMSLLVVMPTAGHVNMSTLAAKLNISDLYARLPEESAVRVKVPKFKLGYTQPLQEVFTYLGLGELFSNPNLARIAEGPLLVSSVMHKSSMEVNEEGAEASAATSVAISRASSPVFYLNQPFFLALVDDDTQVPILMGVVNNPNPGAPVLQRSQPPGSKDKDKTFPIDKGSVPAHGGPPK